jgi:transcription initiation factor TFIIIB Brf1 subunit/transcription initiation factor TFIIB
LFHLISVRDGPFHIPLGDIAEAADIDKRMVFRAYKALRMGLGFDTNPTVDGYLTYFCNRLGLNEKIKRRSLEIASTVKDRVGGNITASGAIIYKATIDSGYHINQEDLADAIGMTGVSLRGNLHKLGLKGDSKQSTYGLKPIHIRKSFDEIATTKQPKETAAKFEFDADYDHNDFRSDLKEAWDILKELRKNNSTSDIKDLAKLAIKNLAQSKDSTRSETADRC